MKRALGRFVVRLTDLIPTRALEAGIRGALRRRAQRLPPKEALKLLLRLDNAVYGLVGTPAIAYGDGAHTKHRHMGYHDFFVNNVRKGERVLDVGCGIGEVAKDVAERVGVDVVAIDLDADHLVEARKSNAHPRVQYAHGDVLTQTPPGPFDVVILSNVLEHIGPRVQFLKDLHAAVRPSRILIRVPLFERDWRVPLKQELGIEYRLDPTHETEYTQESFAQEIQDAKLSIAHHEIRWGEIWAEVVAPGNRPRA